MSAVNTSYLKRIIPEDFNQKDQALIGKIAATFNPAIDQISSILNGGLEVSNLNAIQKQITVQVDANGNPLNSISIASTLTTKCSMLLVGRAYNLTHPQTYPTTAPFISFTPAGTQITVNNITGLTPNDSWQLTIIAFV